MSGIFKAMQNKKKRPVDPNAPPRPNLMSHDKTIRETKTTIEQLQQDLGKTIQTGVFGADMKVALINDGPVTIIMDSKNKE